MVEGLPGPVDVYRTRRGARIYRLPLRLFPGLTGYAHLILADGLAALVDAGSGYGESDADLESAMDSVRRDFGERVGWDSLTHVLLTHGHIDHFGGLPFVRSRTAAPIGVHELDRATVMFHDERLAVVAHRLRRFLVEGGVGAERLDHLMDLYLISKHLYTSQAVDFTYEASGMRVGEVELTHVPGHCPGEVVMRLDDVLLSGDHVLPDISPHQSPEVLAAYTGLGRYLESLRHLKPIAASIRITLGGHERPIEDLAARLEAIESFHRERLDLVDRLLVDPMTMAEVSERLFPEASGYHELLALEEAGAHLEYLVHLGAVGLANPEVLEHAAMEPFRYVHRGPQGLPLDKVDPGAAVGARSARPTPTGGVREERYDVRL